MKFAFVLPAGSARDAADLAYEAEQSGWDGFFVYETVWGTDAWVSLAAAAMRTNTIRLGTDLTPPSRMRPWKLASETATVDDLSNGRLILGVGLGAVDTGFKQVGEVTDRKIRAELLDESLDIITGLWQGQPFSYRGKHYTIDPIEFSAPPKIVQQPRIPIWCVGMWPKPKSMARALRYDGILPNFVSSNGEPAAIPPVEEMAEMIEYIRQQRNGQPYDVIMEGETPGDNPAEARALVQPWVEAGCTWWIEHRWGELNSPNVLEIVRKRIRQGPPRL
jgi:alkanesulfonate monooxygenase SsuD/methylene tetrahydromethanopterin reductase-like flavin-dependent oxidoreductase (luciferase family)